MSRRRQLTGKRTEVRAPIPWQPQMNPACLPRRVRRLGRRRIGIATKLPCFVQSDLSNSEAMPAVPGEILQRLGQKVLGLQQGFTCFRLPAQLEKAHGPKRQRRPGNAHCLGVRPSHQHGERAFILTSPVRGHPRRHTELTQTISGGSGKTIPIQIC